MRNDEMNMGGNREEQVGGDEAKELILNYISPKIAWKYSPDAKKPYNMKMALINSDGDLIFEKSTSSNHLVDAILTGNFGIIEKNYEIFATKKNENFIIILFDPIIKKENSNFIGYSMDLPI